MRPIQGVIPPLVLLLLSLGMFSIEMQAQGIPNGSQQVADYQNILYTQDPASIPDTSSYERDSTAFFNGHVGDVTGDVSGLGVVNLRESGFGQPVQGGLIVPPDFDVGQEIPPLIANVSLTQTPIIDPPAKAFWIPHAQKLFANEAGFVTITWKNSGGVPLTPQTYLISPEPFKEPKKIYHTENSTGGATGAPNINLSAIDDVVIHYNSKFFAPADPMMPQTAPFSFIPNTMMLRAKAGTTGFVLLEYNNVPNPLVPSDFVGIEIVDVRNYQPDFNIDVIVSEKLAPAVPPSASVELVTPMVTNGLLTTDPVADPAHVFQSSTPGAVEGDIWSVRETAPGDYSQVEVFWMETVTVIPPSDSVIWPYEMDRYSASLPVAASEIAQLYVRGDAQGEIGPSVDIPSGLNLNPQLNDWQDPPGHASLDQGTETTFSTSGPGWSLLRYNLGSPPGSEDVVFELIHSVEHDDSSIFNLTPMNWDIGVEVADPDHATSELSLRGGYIHEEEGDRYDPEIYEEARQQIFAVNTGTLEVWWSNVSQGVQWPSKVVRYNNVWPATTEEIVIASASGTGDLTGSDRNNIQLYFQNDPDQPGFNPNDEHAQLLPFAGGVSAFPLRNDLGSAQTSLPYVLTKYQDLSSIWHYRVFSIEAEQAPYFFEYDTTAGLLLQPPFPLNLMGASQDTSDVDTNPATTHSFQDRKFNIWAMAGPDSPSDPTPEVDIKFWYQPIDDFYIPTGSPTNEAGDVPFLGSLVSPATDPVTVTYRVEWPEDVPEMRVGETLYKPKFGLPDISLPCSVGIIYQQATRLDPSKISVQTIDPTKAHSVDLEELSGDMNVEPLGGDVAFPDLPPHLASRLRYNPIQEELTFFGLYVDQDLGEDYFLPNVFSDSEAQIMKDLEGADQAFRDAIDELQMIAADDLVFSETETELDRLALSAGVATGDGYVVLAMQNSETVCDPALPISLEIIRVTCPLAEGQIAVIPASCVFDEKLTLKHTNDLAGQTDDYVFEWATQPAVGGLIPDRPTGQGGDGWVSYPGGTGEGVTFITIEGPGLFTLSDNWFSMRYRPASASDVVCATNDTWSRWTQPQLAEGWVKRVLAGINPFDQRFEDLSDPTRTINTQVNMISQAGPRWEGSVALNCDSVDDFGLIEIYETVYQRAVDLSIGAPIPVDYPPANDALLLVSSKLADLYGLLGNEAFADASDPTISFGISSDETFLQAVTSVHAFENMTSSLTEEELALLRGRDDRLAPPVTTPPVYNRLVWNFSRDLGEVAYALNYDIQDTNGNADGEFSETDARLTYPQGHGDAWGHYLTAITNYYRLLQDDNFTWDPRAEAILIGGAPVTVDFIDEQKFIRAAAARARTGAQIVGLTHRQFYSEDPAEQWKGYKDSNPDRGWGLAEWGSRVGQAALFDWVVGNAMLPEAEEGAPIDITKIDRQSATDLRVLSSQGAVVQEEVDKADVGLNPLGLARNVMPFDIDPSLIDEGMTHFEQIYERAIVALSNAATVFNFANETTQQLRKQADSLDEYKRVVKDGETDFRNRLIETFGTPYADDIGPAGTYPTGYRGPDIYHYDYVEPSELRDEFLGQSFDVPVTEFLVNFTDSAFSIDNPDNTLNVLINDASNEDGIDAATNVEYFERTVEYNVSTDGLGLVKPEGWGRRRVTGRLQETRSDLLQLYAEYRMALSDYTGIIDEIIDTADLIEERFGIRADQIDLMESTANTIATMDVLIGSMQLTQFALEASKDTAKEIANAIAEALPKSSGTSNDVTSAGRGATKAAAASTGANIDGYIGLAMGVELAAEFTKTQTELWNNIEIAELDAELEARENLLELQNLVRNEETLRFDLFGRLESLQQAGNAYLATLDEGLRTLDSFHRFRTETAADIQESRYKDMAFRVFRDDLIQKYRGQFDLAARYAYLAARAYDFETNLLETDSRGPGQNFLTDIVRSRAIGIVQDNDGDGIFNPETAQEFGDPGLSDILARMNLNWNLNLKGQLGFNNPQAETNRFSLRQELYRVAPSPESATGPTMSDETWQMVLDTNTVENVLSLPEFERFARPFFPQNPTEPAIVIPFSTRINFGSNFFGRELATGDSAYNSTNFATKIRSVGVWFEGYENAGLADDPQVYLVPVGQDILRSPTGLAGEIRSFTLLDQVLPVPFPVGPTIQNDPDWLPSDQLTGSFGNIRRYSSFKAFPDSGDFEPDETTTNSRLIGRSVWNTRWVLIIPAGTMLNDRDEALRRFKENVTDILIFFQTYAYSGNK